MSDNWSAININNYFKFSDIIFFIVNCEQNGLRAHWLFPSKKVYLSRTQISHSLQYKDEWDLGTGLEVFYCSATLYL